MSSLERVGHQTNTSGVLYSLRVTVDGSNFIVGLLQRFEGRTHGVKLKHLYLTWGIYTAYYEIP